MVATNQKWLTPLRREQYGPWVLAVLCAVAVVLLHRDGWLFMSVKSQDSYFAAVLSLGGVFTGFMATLKALMCNISDKTRDRLIDSGYQQDLLRYLSEALWGSMSMCIVALVAFWAPETFWLHVVLIGVVVFTIACIIRVTSVTGALLSLK